MVFCQKLGTLGLGCFSAIIPPMISLFRVDKKDIGRFERFLLFFFNVILENIDPLKNAKRHFECK